MFDEALNRLYTLGNSAAAILPGLLLRLVVFGIGLLVARAVRPSPPRGSAESEKRS